jgi:hypothetical protein
MNLSEYVRRFSMPLIVAIAKTAAITTIIDSYCSSCALARTMQCGAVWGREWNEVGLGTDCDLAEGRPVKLD